MGTDSSPSKRARRSAPEVFPVGGRPTSRKRFVREAKSYFAQLTKPLIESRTPKTPGKSFVAGYSRAVDSIIKILFRRAARENGVAEDKAGIAVIATGGYGRSELAPYSDVDILLVCAEKTPIADAVAGAFIRYVWDTGFELGHMVESLVESETALVRHMDSKTALIESRWVCGSRSVARAVERQISRIRRSEREQYLRRKVDDALARYEKHGRSFQLIEPNVKSSPGGLRDHQTLVWLGQVAHGPRGLPALRRTGLLLRGEQKELEAAYDFLLRVRVELHLATRSKQDQLTLAMQKKIARTLGFRARGGHLGVEFFMRAYYHHTRAIYRITADVIEELHDGNDVGVLLGGRRVRPAPDGATLTLPLRRDTIRRRPLYVFERQKAAGVQLDRALRRRLEVLLRRDLRGPAEMARMRNAFAEMFEDGRNLGLVVRSLHESGFLGRIISEYKRLTCLKRYDLYHHYTVDEHSFRVLEALLDLDAHGRAADDAMIRLHQEIDEKRPLYLAALLHDVGKIGGHGHARKGAVLARKILERMSIPRPEIDFVAFLIEHHLLMSHFSQRRDPSDIGTLRAFCDRVGDRNNLKYLCLLTYADYRATSPLVWNEWKRNLLWGLYLRAYEFIEKKEKQPEDVYRAHKQRLLEAFPPGEARERALVHLDLLPGGYLLSMDAGQVGRHMEMIDELDGKHAVVAHRSRSGLHEFTFCTHDQPFRLSQLCGVLAINDFNIYHAHAFTRRDGKVIDVFGVEDLSVSAGERNVEERVASLQRDIEGVIAGKTDLDEAAARYATKWRRLRRQRIPSSPRVKFENDLSGDHTIIDVFAQDVPGLLFRITRALSREGLTISRARISTEADRALDAFYVADRSGRKITSAGHLKRIRTALEREIS